MKLPWNQVCVAAVLLQLRCEFRTSRWYFSWISLGYIYTYICMRGNRRTKNTFVAVKSRSLTDSTPGVSRLLTRAFPPPSATRWRQASPPLRPVPTTRFSPTRLPDPHPGMMEGRWRGSNPSTSSIDGNLTADRKARLPLRSSAKIAMKASRHLRSFSSFLVPLVWRFFPPSPSPSPDRQERKTKNNDIVGTTSFPSRFR